MKQNKVVVLYDGWCPLCIKSIKSLKKFDICNAISYQSFRNEDNIKNLNIDLKQLELRMHAFKYNDNNNSKQGIDAFILIIRYMPLFWITFPFLVASQKLGFGQRVYDYLANKRKIIPVGQCNDNSCNITFELNKKEIN